MYILIKIIVQPFQEKQFKVLQSIYFLAETKSFCYINNLLRMLLIWIAFYALTEIIILINVSNYFGVFF